MTIFRVCTVLGLKESCVHWGYLLKGGPQVVIFV